MTMLTVDHWSLTALSKQISMTFHEVMEFYDISWHFITFLWNFMSISWNWSWWNFMNFHEIVHEIPWSFMTFHEHFMDIWRNFFMKFFSWTFVKFHEKFHHFMKWFSPERDGNVTVANRYKPFLSLTGVQREWHKNIMDLQLVQPATAAIKFIHL
jgi:hypothetical protein